MERHMRAEGGFTLIELTISVVIIGIIVVIGVGSWQMLLKSRQLAKTRSDLLQVKQCLISRAVWSERYPSYNATSMQIPANCSGGASLDVDACLCEGGVILDEWGGRVHFIAGILDSGGASANGQFFIDDDAKGQNATQLHDSDSKFSDTNGETVQNVAFVLVSCGENRSSDTNYFNADCTDAAGQIDELVDGVDLDFSKDDPGEEDKDDIYVFATARELISAVRNQ